jgi:hypothetical protein
VVKATEEPFVSEEIQKHPAWFRLNDQLDWYDRKSGSNQKRYKRIKAVQLVLAGSIPVFSLLGVSWAMWVTAILGASVALLEGLQQLGKYDELWVDYRSTAEQLKHEKYLFLAGSGPYRGLKADEALKLLAERVEERVSTEHAKWVSDVRQTQQQEEQAGPGGL